MKHLPRRSFLRGMGATVALPFLDAMVPALARAAVNKPPCRMAFVYVPNGVVMEHWTPPGAPGEETVSALPDTLPRVLEPLARHRGRITMLSGLTQNGGRALGDGPGDHGRAGASYLTSVHPKKTFGKDIRTGISVDQIAAGKVGAQSRFASLELGCEEGIQGGNCDNGYSCAYSNSLSWRTASTPNPPEVRPRAVFERLFGSAEIERDPVKRARNEKQDRSVLDFVLEEANRLKGTLGGGDRRKLDEYLFAVRDIEKRIQRAERDQARVDTPSLQLPPSIPADFAEHARLMFDLAALAFQTDSTRVITIMLALEQSNRPYREIGVTEAHHGLTHHRGDPEKIEKIIQINQYHAAQFAYFLDKLSAAPEAGGTLLDDSMITYGSGLADGNRHEHHNLPTLLAGRACGALQPGGRHLRYAPETPMANLHVAMLDKMGVNAETLGDSTGRLQYLSSL